MGRYGQGGPGRATASMAAGCGDRVRGGAHRRRRVPRRAPGRARSTGAAGDTRDEHSHAGAVHGGRGDPAHRRARRERRRRLGRAQRDLHGRVPRLGARTGDRGRGADGSGDGTATPPLRTNARTDRAGLRTHRPAAPGAADERVLRGARQRPPQPRPLEPRVGRGGRAQAPCHAGGGGPDRPAARHTAPAPDGQRRRRHRVVRADLQPPANPTAVSVERTGCTAAARRGARCRASDAPGSRRRQSAGIRPAPARHIRHSPHPTSWHPPARRPAAGRRPTRPTPRLRVDRLQLRAAAARAGRRDPTGYRVRLARRERDAARRRLAGAPGHLAHRGGGTHLDAGRGRALSRPIAAAGDRAGRRNADADGGNPRRAGPPPGALRAGARRPPPGRARSGRAGARAGTQRGSDRPRPV